MPLRSTLAKRILFGLLMIVILSGLILLDGWVSVSVSSVSGKNLDGIFIALLATLIAWGGCVEIRRLARDKDINPALMPILITVGLVTLSPYWSVYVAGSSGAGLALGLLAGMCVAGVFQAKKFGNSHTLVNLAVTCFISIYLGVGCWFLVSLRLLGRSGASLWGQVGYLLVFLACVKSSDIGAYFTGRFIGRRPWVPSISPGKTWEGFFGGIILATIVASLFARFSAIIPIGAALWFGPIVAVAGQMGDLLESMLKRDAGIKDSAHLIPEFGGILDLMDSVVAAAPFAWLILSKLSRAGP